VEPVNEPARMSMALHFLRHNPAIKQPVKSLCEHFNISPATLRNLFQRHCGRSPQAVALEIRMNYGKERLLRSDVSVKEVAYELGYRHANDLSRAYKSYFGATARMARPPSRRAK
jgi:transcriptional regulator GlxA family with amidase domain